MFLNGSVVFVVMFLLQMRKVDHSEGDLNGRWQWRSSQMPLSSWFKLSG